MSSVNVEITSAQPRKLVSTHTRYHSPSAENIPEEKRTVIFTIASSGCSILRGSKRSEFRDRFGIPSGNRLLWKRDILHPDIVARRVPSHRPVRLRELLLLQSGHLNQSLVQIGGRSNGGACSKVTRAVKSIRRFRYLVLS